MQNSSCAWYVSITCPTNSKKFPKEFNSDERNNMDFMVGTASFHGIVAEPYRKQLAYLTKNYLSKEDAFAINNTYDVLNDNIEFNNDEEFNNLPTLIKG